MIIKVLTLFLMQLSQLSIVSYGEEESNKAYYQPESKVQINV